MKKALLVIDLQNDYLGEQRKKQFTYNTDQLINSVNALIDTYNANDCDIIYIEHNIQNLWTNRALFGHSIAGTDGAKLFGGLSIASDNRFIKLFPDAFSSKEFDSFIKEKGYDTVAICGLDECGCVSATAKGAIKNGLSVEMLTEGIASRFPASKIEKVRRELKAKGVQYV
ncbi:MAG: cysteine hydrolase [Oscillospiraceae bacterium]|nr:cysteine hydrolase [Oscillospiraceae bacterium]